MKLMEVTDSYWDMLPEEVQMYIWNLKLKQEYLDELKREQWKKVFHEIEQYGELKEKWGLVFVHLCRCKIVGNGRHKMELWGWYYDECNEKKAKFLGDNFEQALGRVNHVKSFL